MKRAYSYTHLTLSLFLSTTITQAMAPNPATVTIEETTAVNTPTFHPDPFLLQTAYCKLVGFSSAPSSATALHEAFSGPEGEEPSAYTLPAPPLLTLAPPALQLVPPVSVQYGAPTHTPPLRSLTAVMSEIGKVYKNNKGKVRFEHIQKGALFSQLLSLQKELDAHRATMTTIPERITHKACQLEHFRQKVVRLLREIGDCIDKEDGTYVAPGTAKK